MDPVHDAAVVSSGAFRRRLVWGVLLFSVVGLFSGPIEAQSIYSIPGGGYALQVAKRWYLDPGAEDRVLRLLPSNKTGGSLTLRAHFTLQPDEAFAKRIVERDLAAAEVSEGSWDGRFERVGDGNRLATEVTFKIKRKEHRRHYSFLLGETRVVSAIYACEVARLRSSQEDVETMLASLEERPVVPQILMEGQEFRFVEQPLGVEFQGEATPSLQKNLFKGGHQWVWRGQGVGGAGRLVFLMRFPENLPKDFEALKKLTEREFVQYSNVALEEKEEVSLYGRQALRLNLTTTFSDQKKISRLLSVLGEEAAYVAVVLGDPEDAQGIDVLADHFFSVLWVPGSSSLEGSGE